MTTSSRMAPLQIICLVLLTIASVIRAKRSQDAITALHCPAGFISNGGNLPSKTAAPACLGSIESFLKIAAPEVDTVVLTRTSLASVAIINKKIANGEALCSDEALYWEATRLALTPFLDTDFCGYFKTNDSKVASCCLTKMDEISFGLCLYNDSLRTVPTSTKDACILPDFGVQIAQGTNLTLETLPDVELALASFPSMNSYKYPIKSSYRLASTSFGVLPAAREEVYVDLMDDCENDNLSYLCSFFVSC